MRTVTTSLANAVTEVEAARMLVKAIIDPSRTFFSALTADYPYDAGDYALPTNTPTGQCMLYYNDKAYTFVVDPVTGAISGMQQGSATKHSLGLTTDKYTKPGCAPIGGGSAYLWYWNSPNITRVTVNLSTWGVSNTTTITPASHLAWSLSACSILAISSTQFVACYYTSIGGISADYWDGSGWHSWDKRFMSPNAVAAAAWSIYTAAAILGSNIFVYSTDLSTGEVRGVEYRPYAGVWTDSFIALPADQSRFCIGNAITANGYIHLAGQFHRTGDLAGARVHSLVLRTADGRSFSWDRFSMLSSLGFCFQIAADTTNLKVYASDRNSVGTANMSYFFTNTPPGQVTLQPPSDILSFQLSNNVNATLRLSSYNEAYMFHSVIKKGSRVQIYLGYQTTAGTEYVKYQTFIIAQRQQGFEAGKRVIALSLEDEGSWKTDQIAFPFYSEILSKVTQLDDCDKIDRAYPVETKAPSAGDLLILDFWDNEEWDGDGAVTGTPIFWGLEEDRTNDPVIWTHDDAETYLFRTANLDGMPQLSEYPTIQAGQTIEASLYGWERAWESPLERVNSTWTLYLVTAPADALATKTVTIGTLHSTYGKFPRDYPTSLDGSYPIIYQWSGLTAGHKVLYIGVRVQNVNAGKSTAVPERLEVTGLDFTYQAADTAKSWTPTNPNPASYDREYLKMPSTGLPAIQFLTKPYTAFNFAVAAEFIYEEGTSPAGAGTTAWGCVGIAQDGNNLVLGRYKRQNSSLEIVKLRAGVESVLTSVAPGAQTTGILFEHRDGRLAIWYKSSTLWKGPALTYQWNEVTQGPLSTSATGIMHCGYYGAVVPPGFYAAGFSAADCKGIAMIPGFPASTLTDFPASGTVVVDGKKYTYSSKSVANTNVYGPYEGRQSGNYGTYKENGVTYQGYAGEIALYKPNNTPALCNGLIFAIDSGHSWLMSQSDWTVTHYTHGVPNYLRNRSRHYADGANGDVVAQRSRHYLAMGLLGISRLDAGATPIHSNWSYVTLSTTDKIYAKRAVATQINQEATVEDMIRYLCSTACVATEFPGSWSNPDLVVNTTPYLLASGVLQYPGGFDIHLDIPGNLASGHWIGVYASNLFLKDPANPAQSEAIDLRVNNVSGTLCATSVPKSGYNPIEQVETQLDPAKPHSLRILFHDEFASFYSDGVCLASFAYGKENLIWPANDGQLYIYIYASTSKAVSVRLSELFDWREAIYIESELSAKSALGSVIQERPIDMAPTKDGGLQFSFNLRRDELSYTTAQCKRILTSHYGTDATSPDAGSDAVVYFEEITYASCPSWINDEGFLTRVYKLSNLVTGAGKAATQLLLKAHQKEHQHQFGMRPDPRIEIGDRVTFTYIVPGTNSEHTYTIIAEDISITIAEGTASMKLSGRQDV